MFRSCGIGTCSSFFILAHVLVGEPASTPDQVWGRLSPEHALAGPARGKAPVAPGRNAASLHCEGYRVRDARLKANSAATGGSTCPRTITPPSAPSTLGVLFQKLDRIADGQNGFGRVVGNLAAELFLE